MQLNIDFSKKPPENNMASQAHFEAHKDKFNEQCQKVYDLMMSGQRLTTLSALQHGIGDLRRRVKDLIDYGNAPVQKRWIECNGSRYKEYYLK